MRALLLLIIIVCLPRLCRAQAEGERFITWSDFVDEYAPVGENGENEPPDWEALEALSRQPLNINAATRAELLLLPFLSEAEADSLLAYRTKKHEILSMGELQLVRGMSFASRRYLSLFAFAAPAPTAGASLAEKLYKGRHAIETSLGMPFVKRAGYKHPGNELLQQSPDKIYLGNALRHRLRYSYRHPSGTAYALVFEKDAGEPFGAYGTRPYDHVSGYVRLTHKAFTLLLGDYKFKAGHGLIAGETPYGGRGDATEAARRTAFRLRPSATTAESGFRRGAALEWRRKQLNVMAFASRECLDAIMTGDTILSVLTTGLHRTQREIARKRASGLWAAGGFAEWQGRHGGFGGGFYHVRYDGRVCPQLNRPYRHYVFRGRDATAFTGYYTLERGPLHLSGELACDGAFRRATKHVLRYAPEGIGTFALQWRHFPQRFDGRFGATDGQGTEVRNERGLMLSAATQLFGRVTATGYLDLFAHAAPTYLADSASHGLEWAAELKMPLRNERKMLLTLRYKGKARQQSVTGHRHLLEYRQIHRARLQFACEGRRLRTVSSLDGSLAVRQTRNAAKGVMLSQRVAFSANKHWTLGGFAGVFFTDNYESALYVYEPQLPGHTAFPAFAYHGMRGVAACSMKIGKRGLVAVRAAFIKYFNRRRISSGTEEISHSWNGDGGVVVKWRF